MPIPEEGGSDTHDGGPGSDGGLEIPAHAGGQLDRPLPESFTSTARAQPAGNRLVNFPRQVRRPETGLA